MKHRRKACRKGFFAVKKHSGVLHQAISCVSEGLMNFLSVRIKEDNSYGSSSMDLKLRGNEVQDSRGSLRAVNTFREMLDI